MREQKGITLIALVITIIVLLILAGVSIAMLTGDNGLLTKANDSKTETLKAEARDRANMEAQAQLANALAGESFDPKATIEKNLNDGKSEGVEFAVSEPSAENGVTITINKPTGLTKNTAEVKKEDSKWVFKAAE